MVEFVASSHQDSSQDSSFDLPDEGHTALADAKPKLKRPRQYGVWLHNDDYTTMEFVVEILRLYFHLSEEQSVQIMMKVHREGKGLAGVYSFEVAETKVVQVEQRAQQNGYPLKCSLEPVDAPEQE